MTPMDIFVSNLSEKVMQRTANQRRSNMIRKAVPGGLGFHREGSVSSGSLLGTAISKWTASLTAPTVQWVGGKFTSSQCNRVTDVRGRVRPHF